MAGSHCLKAVGAMLAALFTLVASSAFAQSAPEIQRMVIQEAQNSRVPPSLALALAKVESNFDPRALSSAGARGVMQIMPRTARDVFGVRENELWNPRLNIQLGIDYLDQLHEQYGGRWDLALSHYNGGTLEEGPGGFPVAHPYTAKYVADVERWQRIYAQQYFRTAPPAWTAVQTGPRFVYFPNPRPAVREGFRRDPSRIDPLEFNDWAEVEHRRLDARRGLDDFTGR